MAVCGRCWFCDYKFSCDESDEAAVFNCHVETCRSAEHKICTRCHDAVQHGPKLHAQLVAYLVQSLLERAQNPDADAEPTQG